MEKDVGLLRCSKLNCYAEFNKMVQSLAHCKHPTVQDMPWAKKTLGTSAEYTFYTTLLTMLLQVVRNSNVESQKEELQRVYEWFRLNKPLLRSHKKPTTKQRPTMNFASPSNTSMEKAVPHERPQTAPASFHESHTHAPRRRPMLSFTSSYVSRSLGHNLDSIGQTFDQLESVKGAMEQGLQSDGTAAKQHSRSCPGTAVKLAVQVSTQAHPSPDFLHGYTPPGFGGVQPHMAESISFGEVFTFAPPVAAQMILNKTLLPEDYKERELDLFRRMLHASQRSLRPSNVAPPQFVNTRANTSPVEMTTRPRSASDMSESSYSDMILSPAAIPASHRPHQQNSDATMTGPVDRGPASLPGPLETIAEADYEVYSSLPSTGRKGGSGMDVTIGQRGDGGEGKGRGHLKVSQARRLEDSLFDPRQPLQPPRVSITSNIMSSSPQVKPQRSTRYPSIVSLTFPTDEDQLPGQTRRGTTRRPNKALSTASIRNKRNIRTRPQTVPAMKIQSYAF